MGVAADGGRLGPVRLAWAEPSRREGSLSLVDQQRLVGFPPARQVAFRTGRDLLTGLIRPLVPASGWEVTTGACRHCGQLHGAVIVTGASVEVSVSYSAGIVVAAAAPASDVGKLGVDVEADLPDPVRDAHLRRLLGGRSEAPLRHWCRVEALLKADGRGLRVDPATVRLDDPAYQVRDVAGPPGFLISLAWTWPAVSVTLPGAARG